ncbi:MAG: deoxyhypusine synthase [Desulfurococcales archaeon ex4484_204]|nr:MAG: deoxyhypusine synthase [Desulfurococcales archaeon ex4484_204]
MDLEGLELVEDVKVWRGIKVVDLVELYGKIHGFTAASIKKAADVLVDAIKRADVRFLSFTGNIVATGVRGLLAQLIDKGYFNVVITTCGAIDHDIARSVGGRYLKGFFEADDRKLKESGYHRLGNIFIPFESYGKLIEDFTRGLINDIVSVKREWGVRELLHEVGRRLSGDGASILGAAYRSGARVYVPGIVDGAFGTDLFMESQFTGFKLNLFKDMKELFELVFTSRARAALVIGGGISKHHTIWWNQFKDGLDYSVYITTAVEWDGSLSGARTREAISWGKVKPGAKQVNLYGDATVLLPLIASYIIERVEP